jgi:hypothetical protein
VKNAARALAFIALLAAACLWAPVAQAKTSDAAAVKRHPLYGMLLQLDREIAALRATLSRPGLADFGADAANDAREAGNDLAAASAHASAFTSHAGDDRRIENDALASLRRAGDAGGLEAYQNVLRQSETASLRSYGTGLDAGADRAYARRAAEFTQAESTLAYQLESRDAAATLPLRIKLADLHPDPETRIALEQRLDAIVSAESKAVSALHARDQAALSAYRSNLIASAGSRFTTASADAQTRTAANMRVRAAVAAPAPGAALPDWPAYGDADLRRITDSAGAFEGARAQIAVRSRELIAVNDESTRGTLAQIASLERERRALYDEILSSSK